MGEGKLVLLVLVAVWESEEFALLGALLVRCEVVTMDGGCLRWMGELRCCWIGTCVDGLVDGNEWLLVGSVCVVGEDDGEELVDCIGLTPDDGVENGRKIAECSGCAARSCGCDARVVKGIMHSAIQDSGAQNAIWVNGNTRLCSMQANKAESASVPEQRGNTS